MQHLLVGTLGHQGHTVDAHVEFGKSSVDTFLLHSGIVVGCTGLGEEQQLVGNLLCTVQVVYNPLHGCEQSGRLVLRSEQGLQHGVPGVVGCGVGHQAGGHGWMTWGHERGLHLSFGKHPCPGLGQFQAIPLIGSLSEHPWHKFALHRGPLTGEVVEIEQCGVRGDVVESEVLHLVESKIVPCIIGHLQTVVLVVCLHVGQGIEIIEFSYEGCVGPREIVVVAHIHLLALE